MYRLVTCKHGFQFLRGIENLIFNRITEYMSDKLSELLTSSQKYYSNQYVFLRIVENWKEHLSKK